MTGVHDGFSEESGSVKKIPSVQRRRIVPQNLLNFCWCAQKIICFGRRADDVDDWFCSPSLSFGYRPFTCSLVELQIKKHERVYRLLYKNLTRVNIKRHLTWVILIWVILIWLIIIWVKLTWVKLIYVNTIYTVSIEPVMQYSKLFTNCQYMLKGQRCLIWVKFWFTK